MWRPLVLMAISVVSMSGLLASSVPAVEPTLATIYATHYGVSLPPPLVDDGRFFVVTDPVLVHVQALYTGATEGLGWYSDGGEYLLMDPLVSGGDITFAVGSGAFGFWMITRYNGTFKCYSDPNLNGGQDRLVVYATPVPEEYFLAWEDCASVDGDYNDVVLIGSRILPATDTRRGSWSMVKGMYGR